MLVFALACEPTPAVPEKPASAAVRVTNLANGEALRHSLVIVDGTAGGASIVVTRVGATTEEARTWPVIGGRFRALVPLRKGRNELKLSASDGGRGDVVLSYTSDDNRHFVRPLYVVPADDDGVFDAEGGEGRDVESAKARLSTAMWLMQAFTAEAMHDAGFGHRTFRLPLDGSGRPVVEVHKSSLTMAQAQAMDGVALWQHLERELSSLPARETTIDVAVMSMTRYDGASRKVSAHAAHGGEHLALFGSGTLHTYAADLDHVLDALADDRAIDASAFFDDSGGRGTHWAAYATGMGALLHELGHCFGLAHAKEGVMSRAFDHVNRKLVLEERGAPPLAPIAEASEVGFDRSSSVRMRYLPYLGVRTTAKGTLRTRVEGGRVVLESSAPIRHVQIELDTMGVAHQEHVDAAAPMRVVLDAKQLRAQHGKGAMKVSAVDDDGNSAVIDVP